MFKSSKCMKSCLRSHWLEYKEETIFMFALVVIKKVIDHACQYYNFYIIACVIDTRQNKMRF